MKTKNINIRVEDKLEKDLKKLAKKFDRPFSNMVRYILKNFIRRHKNNGWSIHNILDNHNNTIKFSIWLSHFELTITQEVLNEVKKSWR